MSASAPARLTAAEATTDADRHPLVAATRGFAREALKPAALETDRNGVKAGTIDQIKALGLLNHRAGTEYGGAALDGIAERRLHEHLAYGCLNTWLVWGQHAALAGRVIDAAAQGRAAGPLCQAVLAGEVLLGAGLSDIRAFPRRYVDATRTEGGWLFNGTLSWATGWGLNDVFAIGAVEAASATAVVGLAPIDLHMRANQLELHSLGGSHTVRLALEGVFVADDEVIDSMPLANWLARDQSQASNAGPHYFGAALAMLDELRNADHPLVGDLLASWEPRVAQLREAAYGLADAVPLDQPLAGVERRAATKAQTGNALMALAQALVVVRAGRAIAGDNTAQLHARNVLFLLIQGQTANVKDAQMASLLRR